MRSIRDFYQAKYRDSLFVVKAGGRIINDRHARHSLLSDIKELTDHGVKILLVYGGGHAIDDALAEAGIEPRKVEGRRITGPREMQLIRKVMAADIGFHISTTMKEIGLNGLTLNSLPASWIEVEPRPRDNAEDYGYDGRITKVYSDQLRRAFDSLSFIATPCLSVTAKDGININADNVAVALAAGAKTRKLILLSDVDGVRLKDGTTATYLTDEEIPALIADGTVTGGMQVKLESCLHALKQGVRRIHLLDGFRDHALLTEVYDSIGPATMIIREEDRQSYLNEVEAEKVIQKTFKATE